MEVRHGREVSMSDGSRVRETIGRIQVVSTPPRWAPSSTVGREDGRLPEETTPEKVVLYTAKPRPPPSTLSSSSHSGSRAGPTEVRK